MHSVWRHDQEQEEEDVAKLRQTVDHRFQDAPDSLEIFSLGKI